MHFRGFLPRRGLQRSIAWVALTPFVCLGLVGCKAGMGSKLSWWPGAGSKDNANLAAGSSSGSAAPIDTVTKPSETQNPYPTTTTPEGYAIEGQRASALASAGASPAALPSSANAPNGPGQVASAAVTYGATPPAATASAGGVAAQVGPYQGWPAGSGPVAGSTPSAAGPAAGTMSAAAATSPSGNGPLPPEAFAGPAGGVNGPAPGSAIAEPQVSGGSSFSATAAVASVPPAATAQTSSQGFAGPATPASAVEPPPRYASSSFTSQFGAASESPSPRSFGPVSPPAQPPTVVPAREAAAPDAPAGPPQAGFASPSASAAPPPPPSRRPDPKYRPGGTTTYRPSQAIVDEPADSSPVRQASFQTTLR